MNVELCHLIMAAISKMWTMSHTPITLFYCPAILKEIMSITSKTYARSYYVEIAINEDTLRIRYKQCTDLYSNNASENTNLTFIIKTTNNV